MKLGRKFTKFAVFTILFVLMSMAFAVVTAMATPWPTEPTHEIRIVPRVNVVRYPHEVVIDVHLDRRPHADAVGNHGIGWIDFFFHIYFDETRFEPIPYSGFGLVGSDYSGWRDVNGNIIPPMYMARRVNPIAGGHPGGTLLVRTSSFNGWTPVMSDVVLHLRFRVLENAPQGSNIEFRWGHAMGMGAGWCPVIFISSGIHTLELYGPYDRQIGRVCVFPPGKPTQPTHEINIVPRTASVSRSEYVELDVHIIRLPYADTVGDYGIGGPIIRFEINFDLTRFALVQYEPGVYMGTDVDTWIDMNGNIIKSSNIATGHSVPGMLVVMPQALCMTPVMSSIVLHLRFMALENAELGDNIVFSWDNGDFNGHCPVGGAGAGIFIMPVRGPFPEQFGLVTVI